ncbi:MAG: hypothetical protein IJ128_01385 [Firmicutes bacterium]|nr:hypothetical protein [Bacillota bacterium]
MSFYENEHITENYLSQVEDLLIDRYHITETDARAAVDESGLKAAIEGCPYIAMHLPAAKAADTIAKKAPQWAPIFAFSTHASL